MKHGSGLSFDDEGRPVLITRAALAYEEQHRARVRKYLTLMSFRIPALILAAVAYSIWENGLVSLGIVALSIPLPWMAVLIANDRPPRRAEEPAASTTGGSRCFPQPNGPHSTSAPAPHRNRTSSATTPTRNADRRDRPFSAHSQDVREKPLINTCEAGDTRELLTALER